MSDLPQGWAEIAIGDVGQWGSGGTPKSDNKSYYGGSIPWIRSGDLADGPIIAHEIGITEEGLANSSAKWVPEGAVLIAMYGATIGKLGITTYPVTTNQAVAFCAVNDAVEPRLLFHGLAAKKQDLIEMGQGGAQPNISQQLLKAVEFPLPPLPEQRRIVAKVDGLTARTARARKELDRLPTLIARYKQRLLALAYSGELTEGWRKANPYSSTQLRSQIGIDGRSTALGEIPTGWNWTSFGEMAGVTGGLTKNKSRESLKTRAPYLRVANVYANELRLDDVTEIGCTESELTKTLLLAGDLLIVEGNGSIEQVGRAALWNGEIDGCSHQNHIIRARPNPDLVPRYGLFWLLSPDGRSAIEGVASSSSGLHTLSITKVKGFPIPVCPPEEQAEIVRRIESAFGWLDRVAADHAAAARLLPKLDAAILSKAFRGELVPQDPNDEPASILLDRIRAEREADADKPKRGKGRPRVHHLQAEGISTGPPQIGTPTLTVRTAKSKGAAMSKSRQDDDVKDKPYLANLLKNASRADVQTLFKASDLPVADFYKQLAWEIDKKHIIDSAEELKAA